MMKRKLIFWTAFNSYQSPKLLRNKPKNTIHPVATEKWTARRADLFSRFNLKSILAQKRDDWLYVVLLDPKLREMTDRLMPKIDDERIIYCYEDGDALERIKKYDEIIYALIDSDDMYATTAADYLMTANFRWAYFKYGYALEERRGRLWLYDTIHTGPFFAQRINPKSIQNFDRDKRHPTHKAIADLNPTELAARQFCVLLHDQNTSSTPHMRYVIKKPVDKTVLNNFGIGK